MNLLPAISSIGGLRQCEVVRLAKGCVRREPQPPQSLGQVDRPTCDIPRSRRQATVRRRLQRDDCDARPGRVLAGSLAKKVARMYETWSQDEPITGSLISIRV